MQPEEGKSIHGNNWQLKSQDAAEENTVDFALRETCLH